MAHNIEDMEIPERLMEISDPPKSLRKRGAFPDRAVKYLAVVGSRKFTSYGKDVCEKLIEDLAGYPIVIVSGLALGIDSIAHESAIKAGLKVVAIPGSGLSDKVLYPKSNFLLANKILKADGCLISEFADDFLATNWSFPQRNRIMAGLSDAVLVVEAQIKSGSLITARLAMEYNRDVLVVPGPIFSVASSGTNSLLKDGAHPCLSATDILTMLGFKENEIKTKNYDNCTEEEREILELLYEPMPKEMLMQKYPGSVTDLNTLLTLLEIKGHIKETMGEIRKV